MFVDLRRRQAHVGAAAVLPFLCTPVGACKDTEPRAEGKTGSGDFFFSELRFLRHLYLSGPRTRELDELVVDDDVLRVVEVAGQHHHVGAGELVCAVNGLTLPVGPEDSILAAEGGRATRLFSQLQIFSHLLEITIRAVHHPVSHLTQSK